MNTVPIALSHLGDVTEGQATILSLSKRPSTTLTGNMEGLIAAQEFISETLMTHMISRLSVVPLQFHRTNQRPTRQS